MHARLKNPELQEISAGVGNSCLLFPQFHIQIEVRTKKRVVIGGSHGKLPLPR